MCRRDEDVCCLIHSMDGERGGVFFFCLFFVIVVLDRGKINQEKNEIKVHVSRWQWRLRDVEESHNSPSVSGEDL